MRFILPQWPAKKHKCAQNCAKKHKKHSYAIPPLLIPLSLRAQILKKFNLAWNFQSRLKFSISTFRIPHKNRGLVGGPLENFNLAWKFQDLENFQDLGPLGFTCHRLKTPLKISPARWGKTTSGALSWWHLIRALFLHSQRRRKRARPPPKENLLGNFSGLKEKLSRSVVDTKNTMKNQEKPSLPPKSFLCGPQYISAKKSSGLEQGGVFFPRLY